MRIRDEEAHGRSERKVTKLELLGMSITKHSQPMICRLHRFYERLRVLELRINLGQGSWGAPRLWVSAHDLEPPSLCQQRLNPVRLRANNECHIVPRDTGRVSDGIQAIVDTPDQRGELSTRSELLIARGRQRLYLRRGADITIENTKDGCDQSRRSFVPVFADQIDALQRPKGPPSTEIEWGQLTVVESD